MTEQGHRHEDGETPDLNAFRQAYRDAVEAVEAVEDPQTAFEQATVLRDAADAMVGEAADLRARMAERIFNTEKLSLSALAERIGVSKSRADQFIRTAKTTKTKEEEQ